MRAVTILSRTPKTVREGDNFDYRYESLVNKLAQLTEAEPKHGSRNGWVMLLKSQVENITFDIGFICEFKGGLS